jgi:hypothetical protein
LGQFDQLALDLFFPRQIMALNLEEKIVLPEDLLEQFGLAFGFGHILLLEEMPDRSAETARKSDQAIRV